MALINLYYSFYKFAQFLHKRKVFSLKLKITTHIQVPVGYCKFIIVALGFLKLKGFLFMLTKLFFIYRWLSDYYIILIGESSNYCQ